MTFNVAITYEMSIFPRQSFSTIWNVKDCPLIFVCTKLLAKWKLSSMM